MGVGFKQNVNQSQVQGLDFNSVVLSVTYKTRFGENLYLTGSEGFLGKWNPHDGINLTWSDGHRWFKKMTMPEVRTMQNFEFKFVIINHNQNYTNWEGGENHNFDLSHLEQQLDLPQVKQHLQNMDPREDRFFIGSFVREGSLKVAGTSEEKQIKKTKKTSIYYC